MGRYIGAGRVFALVMQGRRLTIAVVFALVALCAPATATGSSLPTHAQIEHRTDRFLERVADRPSARVAARPGRRVADPVDLRRQRVVALYGAPQMGRTILGLKSVKGAGRKLKRQAAAYEMRRARPAARAFDLVATFATAGGGPDGLYRTRQDDDIIAIYLRRARKTNSRLILDIQPGRSSFISELRALRKWIVQPDVDVALDAEWNVGRRGIPGRTLGKVTLREVKRLQRYLGDLVRDRGLPPKVLLVHQFRRGSVRARAKIRQVPGVQTVLNFDGIGAPGPKASGYAALSAPRLFNGFSLFYRRDEPLMRPSRVLRLEPEPDFVLYQ